MSVYAAFRDLGQSIWLDNLSRDLIASGMLDRYIRDFAVTGVTSNPTIFDLAISSSGTYDPSIQFASHRGRSSEDVFFDLAIEDVQAAADRLLDVHRTTNGMDGWVSLEVPP